MGRPNKVQKELERIETLFLLEDKPIEFIYFIDEKNRFTVLHPDFQWIEEEWDDEHRN